MMMIYNADGYNDDDDDDGTHLSNKAVGDGDDDVFDDLYNDDDY